MVARPLWTASEGLWTCKVNRADCHSLCVALVPPLLHQRVGTRDFACCAHCRYAAIRTARSCLVPCRMLHGNLKETPSQSGRCGTKESERCQTKASERQARDPKPKRVRDGTKESERNQTKESERQNQRERETQNQNGRCGTKESEREPERATQTKVSERPTRRERPPGSERRTKRETDRK